MRGDNKYLDMHPLIMTKFVSPRLENREKEKCHPKVSEFDFDHNIWEMSGNFVSDCNIYDKGPQFCNNPEKIAYTNMYIVMSYIPASKPILANIDPLLATNWQPMPIMTFRYQYWPNIGYHQ